MPPLYGDDDTRKAFQGAVRSLEMRTGVEVLVAIRERSGLEPVAAIRAGIVAGLLVLAFLVFSPWEFRDAWFLIDPIVFGLLGAFITARISSLERLFTSARERKRGVQEAAAFTFFRKGLHLTRDRTGLLVYLGVRERLAIVLADQGILSAVDPEVWRKVTAAIGEALATGTSSREVAACVSALGHVLGDVKRREGDVNEVAEEVVVL